MSQLANSLQQTVGAAPSKQHLMDSSFWEGELVKANSERKKPSKNILADIAKPGYWNTVPKDKTANRRVDDIAKQIGPEILAQLQAGASGSGNLKVYRTMDAREANDIMQWKANKGTAEQWVASGQADSKTLKTNKLIIPVGGHMGDYGQAKHYRDKDKNSCMMEFKLKPGAHNLLFSDKCMAIARSGRQSATMTELNMLERGRPFPEANKNEGTKPGYIGFKSERHGDFSLAVGQNDPTALLFQLLLEDAKVIE